MVSPFVSLPSAVFDNILKFCNAQEYLKMGQTCQSLRGIFADDGTWHILVHGFRLPVEDDADFDNAGDVYCEKKEDVKKFVNANEVEEDPFQLVGDVRIPTIFEQIMIGHNLIRVKQERDLSDTILLGKCKNDFVRLWLLDALQNFRYRSKEERIPFVGKLWEMWLGGEVLWSKMETTFLTNFAALVEANVLYVLEGAHQAAMSNMSHFKDYPMLSVSDLHAFVDSAKLNLMMMEFPLHQFLAFFPRASGFAPYRLYWRSSNSRTVSMLDSTYKMIQRLIFRAGVVKFEHAVFNYVAYFASALVTHILSHLGTIWLEEMDGVARNCGDIWKEEMSGDTGDYEVHSRHLELAARLCWLPITRVFMDEYDDGAFHDIILETVGAAQWSAWSTEEKYAYCESLDSNEDMDLDMADFVHEDELEEPEIVMGEGDVAMDDDGSDDEDVSIA